MTLVELPVGSKEFERIASYITKSYKNACIMSIERIDNHPLQQAYNALKASLSFPTEMTLFHGTTSQAALTIVNHGYDPSYSKRCAYGIGIYFAKNAATSCAYMDVGQTKSGFELSYMLVNTVLIGRMTQGQYDSVCNLQTADCQVDNIQSPTILSIPRKEQAIPNYLVTFHKNAPNYSNPK